MINAKKEKSEVEKVEDLLEDTEGKEEEILEKVHKFEVSKKDADIEKMITEARQKVLKFKESLPPPPPPTITLEDYFFPELQSKKGGCMWRYSQQTGKTKKADPALLFYFY